ncbi:30S ribosomal protein S6 [Candidatus Saccharibacteria bacterium]|nr:30S ribosomal protein S6 [Candidatus Saccharibacteria bacterium]
MREYELTVLLHPDLEMDLDAPLEKVRKVVTSNGGEIVKEDNWGKRKLAYPIKKENFAVYICFAVKLPAEAAAKISNTFNITDEVLRYLLVMVDEKTKAKLQEAENNKDEESSKE